MPVLISEIVFKGEISAAAPRAEPAGKPPPRRDDKALVEACVEEVMRVLARREER